MQMFQVGGCVRDEILGVGSNDIDFTVVLEETEIRGLEAMGSMTPFEFMENTLTRQGFKIFLSTPEFLTVRAQFPKGERAVVVDSSDIRKGYKNLTADFVLARKESDYTDGRRPDVVEPGTLEDDLARRDFTMNAIAKSANGSYIDPFFGQRDIEKQIIRAVGDPFERLTEDALRAVRALRFSVTKGFRIDSSLSFAMQSAAVLDAIATKISDERIQVELSKMFRFDTLQALKALKDYPALTTTMFAGSISLDATMKTKGRGR